ncbi:MAG: MOSC domain-containing protein [Thermoanaerobaculia bacterium]
MAEVLSIWIKRAHGGVMDAVEEATLVVGSGVEGSADQGGRRQITVLDEAAWQRACRDAGAEVDPKKRRANVLVRGVELEGTQGKVLRIGSCHILIHGETRPCNLMDEMQPGLRSAMGPEWRGGVYGEILDAGQIRIGDEVEVEKAGAGD